MAQGVALSWRLFTERVRLVQASLSILVTALVLPLVGTATYLVCLHGYLVCTGMTTYYYWMQRSPKPVRAQAITASFNSVNTGITELSAGGLWSRPVRPTEGVDRSQALASGTERAPGQSNCAEAQPATSSCAAMSSGGYDPNKRVSWDESCTERQGLARSNSIKTDSSRRSRVRRSESLPDSDLTARRFCRKTSTTSLSAASVVSNFLMAPLASNVPVVDAAVEPLEADAEPGAARDQLLATGVSDLTVCEGPAGTHVPRGSPLDGLEDGD